MPIQRIEGFGAIGLNTDLSPASLPDGAWTTCKHVIPRDGKAVRAWDTDILFSLAIEPRFHLSFRDASDKQWLVVGDGTRVFIYDINSGAGEEITPYAEVPSPVNSDRCSFVSHNGVLCYSTYLHGIFYWPGPGNQLAAFPSVDPGDGSNIGWRYDLGWRCVALASYKYYLVALGMNENGVEFPHKLRWSSSAEEGAVPTEWTATTTNDAGDDILGETSGQILGSQLVRDSLWVLKTDSVYSLDWIGGDFVIQTRRLAGVLEVSSREATAEYLGSLILLSGKDVYTYDGTNMGSLIEKKVRNAFNESFAARGFDRGRVFVDRFVENIFVLGKPLDAYRHSEALVLDPLSGAWGHMFLNGVYALVSVILQDGVSSFRPEIVALESDTAGGNYRVSKLTNDVGVSSSYTSRLQRLGIPIFGAPGRSMVTEVWPETTGDDATVDLTVYGQDTLNGAAFSDGPYAFNSRTTPHLAVRVSGRFMGYELSCSTPGGWEINNMTFRYEPAGER